jgi:hypothetical protein
MKNTLNEDNDGMVVLKDQYLPGTCTSASASHLVDCFGRCVQRDGGRNEPLRYGQRFNAVTIEVCTKE